mmetsp:Transcript_49090/g.117696  ORF Transcript_49090/g.117696 Transcript_49090/m.117696 type:complete len:226 (+) Transcript_49090:1103-1780(+)
MAASARSCGCSGPRWAGGCTGRGAGSRGWWSMTCSRLVTTWCLGRGVSSCAVTARRPCLSASRTAQTWRIGACCCRGAPSAATPCSVAGGWPQRGWCWRQGPRASARDRVPPCCWSPGRRRRPLRLRSGRLAGRSTAGVRATRCSPRGSRPSCRAAARRLRCRTAPSPSPSRCSSRGGPSWRPARTSGGASGSWTWRGCWSRSTSRRRTLPRCSPSHWRWHASGR